jgi:hypothetical protein
MPGIQSHIQQWKHNRAFLLTIAPEYPDWLVTAAFYVALHAVDALLASDKISPTTHAFRNSVLLKTNRYTEIRRGYMPLYNLSQTVRYLADPGQWIPADRIQPDVIQRCLSPIEKSVQKLIGQDLALPKLEIVH